MGRPGRHHAPAGAREDDPAAGDWCGGPVQTFYIRQGAQGQFRGAGKICLSCYVVWPAVRLEDPDAT